jgi:hypothetical protein
MRQYGAVDCLPKPIDAAALQRLVAPYCRPFSDD